MTFLSAQHLTTYYLWQVKVCIYNLASNGINREHIHVLFATCTKQRLSLEDQTILASIQRLAKVFFYKDDRKEINYPSSIRPHIIIKHFSSFPELQKEFIFYHDCDILFRELPPLLDKLNDDTWYVSNTADYLNSQYIKSHIGEKNFVTMCDIVGIDPSAVLQQDANCGGAQYIMANVSKAFWEKVGKDCVTIYSFLQEINWQMNIEKALQQESLQYSKGIQIWCADMWAMLWNSLFFGHTIRVHTDLNFCWPKNSVAQWDNNYLLHNAGVAQSEAEWLFYKGNYIYHTPFGESFDYVDNQSCSSYYCKSLKKAEEESQGLPLSDMSFLIPCMIDSQDRLDNLYTTVRYLQKHFFTNIIILEYGKKQLINLHKLPKRASLFFVRGDEEMFHRTYFNNQMIEVATTPFISIYDTDVIIPKSQIVDAMNLLRASKCEVVYPYDGTFLSVDKLSSAIFSKFLEDEFLIQNNEKFIVSSRRSFGGCVFLNRNIYIKAGKENIKFTSWGPEDMERYHRMKILGFRINRIKGVLYHMNHERGKNSGYHDFERKIAFMEEYNKIFNMKRNELEKYISSW